MFERPHHQRIAHVLAALDGAVLAQHQCRFGGGTCIALQTPPASDQVCGVSALTALDLATSKLLANTDRQADDGVFSRDLIDLTMMDLPLPQLRSAVDKATQAYGPAITRDLAKAIDRAEQLPKAMVWQKIRRLNRLRPQPKVVKT